MAWNLRGEVCVKIKGTYLEVSRYLIALDPTPIPTFL